MQTLDPFYVDVNIATSAEFQARLTDYVDLVTSFPDETAICNIYRHTDAHSDPITSKIEFFKNFATGNLNLQTVFNSFQLSKEFDLIFFDEAKRYYEENR